MQPEKRNHRESNSVTYKSSKRPRESDIPSKWKLAPVLDVVLANAVFKGFLLTCCCTLVIASGSAQELALPQMDPVIDRIVNGQSADAAVPALPASESRASLLHSLNQTISSEERISVPDANNSQGVDVAGIPPLPQFRSEEDSQEKSSREQNEYAENSASLIAMIKNGSDPLDEDLVNAVVTALEVSRVSGEISGFGVDVKCNRGVIQLAGIASSPEQRAVLIEIARSVPGVFAVYESISILSKSQKEAFGLQESVASERSHALGGREITADETATVVPPLSSRRSRGIKNGRTVGRDSKTVNAKVDSSSDAGNSAYIEDRRNNTGNGLPFPNLKQNLSAKHDEQSGLLKQLRQKFNQPVGKSNGQAKTKSSLRVASNSKYQNLLKIIAAGETGQDRVGQSPNLPAEVAEGPGAMSLPKVKRKPRRQAKALPNVGLIPVDAMIFRGSVPDIKTVGNRTYQNDLQGTDAQQIASNSKRSALMGSQQRTPGDTRSQNEDLKSVARQSVKESNASLSLLLPPAIRSDEELLAQETQTFAATNLQLPANPQTAQTTPVLPPVPQPPTALATPVPSVGGTSPTENQGPAFLNPAQASPDIFNTPNPSAIESIPVPLGAQIEGSGVAPVQQYDFGVSSAAQTTNQSFKHRLFRGLCGGVCGGVCGCLGSESLSFGTEGTYLAPIGEGTAHLRVNNLVTGEVQEAESVAGFAAGQRFWVQLQSNNVGLAAEYWFLGNRVLDFSDYYVPPSDFGSQSNYLLDLNVFDLEYFQQFCCCGINFRASLGARYFELDRINALHGSGKTADVLLSSSSRSSYQSRGFGATLGVAGKIPLRCLGCHRNGRGWNLFWQLRSSILDTDAILQARTEAHAVSTNGTETTANSVDEVHVSWEGATSNGMLQLGLAYQWAIPQCRALGNVYLGFEGHFWQTAPVGLESTSQAFLEQTGSDPFGASIVTSAETNPKDLGFAGFVWGLALYH